MSEDLAAWLLEQIAEDERLAKAVGDDQLRWHYGEFDENVTYADVNGYVACGPWNGDVDANNARHMVNFDPARALVECGAKRRIVERHAPRIGTTYGPYEGELICGCSDGSDEFHAVSWPCADVRDITSVFAGRPGYREEWRPSA